MTKPVREREPVLRNGVRILPGRNFSFAVVGDNLRDIGQYRLPIVAQVTKTIMMWVFLQI